MGESSSHNQIPRRTLIILIISSILLVLITALTTSLIWSVSEKPKSSDFKSTNPSVSSCPASNFPLNYNPYYDQPIPKKEINQETLIIQNGLLWTATGTNF